MGGAIAAQVREEARERAVALHERGITPGLALVLVGENPSSMSYVRSKGDAAEQAGLYSDTFHFAESTDQETVTSRILELNHDRRFHGILVQLPLPKQIHEDAVMNCIDPAKDADGVTPANLGHLLRGEPCPWPATPAGVIELLHRTGNAPAGKHVVICGRSNIVGKPLAGILMQKNERANATVTMCHTGTPNLGYHTRQADILIAAMGVAGGITADMVKPGAVVIDVGNNWIEDATPQVGPASRGRRGLRGRARGGLGDHAGAWGRRADDGGDADLEHGVAGREVRERGVGGVRRLRAWPRGWSVRQASLPSCGSCCRSPPDPSRGVMDRRADDISLRMTGVPRRGSLKGIRYISDWRANFSSGLPVFEQVAVEPLGVGGEVGAEFLIPGVLFGAVGVGDVVVGVVPDDDGHEAVRIVVAAAR